MTMMFSDLRESSDRDARIAGRLMVLAVALAAFALFCYAMAAISAIFGPVAI